jgi:hypothetical protein
MSRPPRSGLFHQKRRSSPATIPASSLKEAYYFVHGPQGDRLQLGTHTLEAAVLPIVQA